MWIHIYFLIASFLSVLPFNSFIVPFLSLSLSIYLSIYLSLSFTIYLFLISTFYRVTVLCTFFWVISRRLNFICRRFGTLCLFHLHRRVGMKMEKGVPKRRYIKFRRWGITQKKAYNLFTA